MAAAKRHVAIEGNPVNFKAYIDYNLSDEANRRIALFPNGDAFKSIVIQKCCEMFMQDMKLVENDRFMTPEKCVITSKFNKQAVLDSINFLFKSLRITMGAVQKINAAVTAKNRHQAAHTTNNKIRPNKQYCGNATTSSYYKK